jgi:putative endonuclease
MWYVYIIQSEANGSYYIGSTQDVHLRVERHNAGWSRSTRGHCPWKLVYFEEYRSKSEALRRERYLKRMKSRKLIGDLITGWNDRGGRH